MSHRDLIAALATDPEIGRETVCRLATAPAGWLRGGSCAEALGVPPRELRRARRLARDCRGAATRLAEGAERCGAELLLRGDRGYPAPLLDLELPPPLLYVRGRLPRRPGIGIVGSRAADAYGLEAAEMFGRELAARGLTVVSGFARGVDTAAHRGALAAPGGRTVAVLGSGIDVDYPRGHGPLAGRIARAGAVISEFPLGAEPRGWQFPVRNRIIAALSLGVLVVQATPRSGSLITARQALELGRDVYAVPAPIFGRRGAGPNTLIRDGALAAQHPRDIVESLPASVQEGLRPGEGEEEEREEREERGDAAGGAEPGGAAGRVLGQLGAGDPRTPDDLAAATGLDLPAVLGALLELEIGGWLRRYPGPTFTRRRG